MLPSGKVNRIQFKDVFQSKKEAHSVLHEKIKEKKCFAPGSEYKTANNKKEMEMNIWERSDFRKRQININGTKGDMWPDEREIGKASKYN